MRECMEIEYSCLYNKKVGQKAELVIRNVVSYIQPI